MNFVGNVLLIDELRAFARQCCVVLLKFIENVRLLRDRDPQRAVRKRLFNIWIGGDLTRECGLAIAASTPQSRWMCDGGCFPFVLFEQLLLDFISVSRARDESIRNTFCHTRCAQRLLKPWLIDHLGDVFERLSNIVKALGKPPVQSIKQRMNIVQFIFKPSDPGSSQCRVVRSDIDLIERLPLSIGWSVLKFLLLFVGETSDQTRDFGNEGRSEFESGTGFDGGEAGFERRVENLDDDVGCSHDLDDGSD